MSRHDVSIDALPLPDGWIPLPDPQNPELVYFYNVKSRVSQWSRPETRIPPSLVRARHILVKHANVKNPVSKGANPGPVTRTEEEALEIITQVYEQLVKEPSRFAEFAQKMSDCKSYSRGGDLHEFKKEAMHREFSDAAFALKVNEMSGVIASPSGYHIVLRTE
jgi:NIMA-interacting peptidyl-prolyl cis-trans isomerase 1